MTAIAPIFLTEVPRFVLVGEAPARDESRAHLEVILALRSAGKFPPGGKVLLGRDLSWLHGRRSPGLFEFVARTVHVNLLSSWPGRGRKGSEFPARRAKNAATDIAWEWLRGRPAKVEGLELEQPDLVLLAGRRVALAFGLSSFNYLELVRTAWGLVVVVPHPSGANPWLNSPARRRNCRRFLEDLGR
jgi:hypothetical protein